MLKTAAAVGESNPRYIYRPYSNAVNNFNFREAVRIISDHPFLFMQVELEGIFRLLLSPGVGYLSKIMRYEHYELIDIFRSLGSNSEVKLSQSGKSLTTLFIAYQAVFLSLMFLGLLIGSYRLIFFNRFPNIVIIFGVTLIYLLAASGGPEANSRFRIPALPFISFFSSFGIAFIINKLNKYCRSKP